MAYAPAEDPKIALAVIVENAGFGAANAAPIARRVFDYCCWAVPERRRHGGRAARAKATTPIGSRARRPTWAARELRPGPLRQPPPQPPRPKRQPLHAQQAAATHGRGGYQSRLSAGASNLLFI
jgi:penicillin-binding protein 2